MEIKKNKAYGCQGIILVFTGEIKDDKAKFLEHFSENGEDIMIKRKIPMSKISLEEDVIRIKDGEGDIESDYTYNQNSLFDSKKEFQKSLNQYNNAII